MFFSQATGQNSLERRDLVKRTAFGPRREVIDYALCASGNKLTDI